MEFNYESLLGAIKARDLGLNSVQCEAAARFGVILDRENKLQNLTRITGVKDFIEGHLLDVVKLFHVEQLGEKVLDIGSGSGVPGLLAASIDLSPSRQWILTDSERSKAEYLESAAKELGLERVSVYPLRVEEVLKMVSPDTIMARAVGTVEKISNWIWNCSTWNNLILFKSRGWNDEWVAAKQSRFGKKLTVTQSIEYSSEDKFRLLVILNRK